MSWYQLYDDRNGFVKAVNRATTSVMQSTGRVEKTVFASLRRLTRILKGKKNVLKSMDIFYLLQEQFLTI
jgi:hypothetical protein